MGPYNSPVWSPHWYSFLSPIEVKSLNFCYCVESSVQLVKNINTFIFFTLDYYVSIIFIIIGTPYLIHVAKGGAPRH